MKKLITILMLLTLVGTLSAADIYDTGDMMFTFKGGVNFPLGIRFFNSEETDSDHYSGMGTEETNTKLHLGGNFGLNFEKFANSKISLGGELGYQFNYTASKKLFTCLPFVFKTTWYPVQGKVDLPISLGLGFNYMRLGADKSMMTLFSNIEVGAVVYFWEHWGLGVRSGITMIPELNYKKENRNKNAVLSLSPVVFSVTYRN